VNTNNTGGSNSSSSAASGVSRAILPLVLLTGAGVLLFGVGVGAC
jgi:hypothetical protein